MWWLIAACERSIFEVSPQEIPTGEYRGSYSLLRKNASDRNAQGTNFAEGTMALVVNATSRTYRVVALTDSLTPPSSEGTYLLRFGVITFRDRSARTFQDPSTVFNGDYTYTYDGSSLVITLTDTVRKREHSAFLTRF
jgi:hypothetical protein